MADKTGIQVQGLANNSDVDPNTTQTSPGDTLRDQPGVQSNSPVAIETTRLPTAVGKDTLELREYQCVEAWGWGL